MGTILCNSSLSLISLCLQTPALRLSPPLAPHPHNSSLCRAAEMASLARFSPFVLPALTQHAAQSPTGAQGWPSREGLGSLGAELAGTTLPLGGGEGGGETSRAHTSCPCQEITYVSTVTLPPGKQSTLDLLTNVQVCLETAGRPKGPWRHSCQRTVGCCSLESVTGATGALAQAAPEGAQGL